MNPLHEQFITEARELIQQAAGDLIAAEQSGFSEEQIDRVFRAFHTLKGSAGVVELPAMALTLHAAEDLLAAIQAGQIGPTSHVIDQALACLDQVSGWVDAFEAHTALPADAGDSARAMAEQLRLLLARQGSEQPGKAPSENGDHSLPGWAKLLIKVGDLQLRAHEGATQLFAFSYEPHGDCFFNGDDPLGLMQSVPSLLVFHVEPREAWPPLSDLDLFVCNLRLQGISAAPRKELSDVFRLVPDQVHIVAIPIAAAPRELPPGGNADSTVRAVLQEQMQVLRASGDPDDQAGRVGAAARAASNALRHIREDDWSERVERAGAAALAERDSAALLSVLEDSVRSLASDATVPAVQTSGPEPSERRVGRQLRVDESKVDALIDLAGELVVLQNGFAHLAKRANSEIRGSELAGAIRTHHDSIKRIADELHDAILQLRMVPIAQVFRSFPRLVRDLSRQLDKSVSLVARGETTDCDKTVADLLFEPLMHLVRNALDHGIETADQRRTAGKALDATIILQASRMGDRLVIEVTDDGRGIDPAAVRSKAVERSLLTAEELAALSDEQAIDLIFSAGFSTAAEVSDISGRGIGMDVVRSTVERIGGRVSLRSQLGRGTTVKLDLPINIAMLRIMVVEAGGQAFGIPMDSVSETVRLTPDRISRIKNNDGFVLHERVVPICPLAEFVKLPPRDTSTSDVRLIVVAEINGKITGLEVDAIRDRLEVVLKPMQGLLANAHGYAGTTLLGDGAVLLVLDLREILS
jgi:two-component system chemotaxis sensor kinase CheA